jgi:hypothetical protein
MEITIKEDRVIGWDRGWDAEGNQVWGPDSGGYIFRKVETKPHPGKQHNSNLQRTLDTSSYAVFFDTCKSVFCAPSYCQARELSQPSQQEQFNGFGIHSWHL